ncbi:MAG: NAD-dependent epimerase/dehydratase family protein [Aggregatilineales bacterium]
MKRRHANTKRWRRCGGTRNMGYSLAMELLNKGHRVTVLNRGMTRDDLPEQIMRLRADRTDIHQMRRALKARKFDVVADFVMFNGQSATQIIDLLRGNTDHYIFISTGQVYLVREDIERPFREDDYAGRIQPQPKENTFAYEEWRYGHDKRAAEDALRTAWQQDGFPFTSLRLPMVNSRRDHYDRLYNYVLRLQDGNPILAPQTPRFPLRHVYAQDVVQAILRLIDGKVGIGESYNISQDETVTLDEFLSIAADAIGKTAEIVYRKRSELEANGFLPDCSPFSERWMSELANKRSKRDLGMQYTPLTEYLPELVRYFVNADLQKPPGYKRRPAELNFLRQPEWN